ncbi:MAG TPA: shikimate dehydrogenase [Rhodospirillaceae bacterium]|nr:shikimate dehydrogenase [Rhodospirillaceae bacterium]
MIKEKKTEETILTGVMGWPIAHSKSPYLHGHWLAQNKINGAYLPLAVDPDKIEQALRALPVLGFKGCNLTLPHKEKALPFLDKTDDLVRRVGATNTIFVHDNGMLEGRNTDVYGFSENLKQAGFVLDRKNPIATVLGAGGASRAIIVALQDMGFQEIRLVNRNLDRAQKIAQSLAAQNRFEVLSWQETERALKGSALLINATSLGMAGQPDLDIDLTPLLENAWVTDAVYAPLETTLLKKAKERKLQTVDGLGMLLHQAAPAFEAWFGCLPKVTPDLRDYVLSTT